MEMHRTISLAVSAALLFTGGLSAQTLEPLVAGQGALFEFDGLVANGMLGASVADAGDVDGDGVTDLIFGAADSTGLQPGAAFVHSGATGAQIWRFDGLSVGDSFGFSVSGAGDVDGDGFDDVIVGASTVDIPGIPDSRAGAAYVYSGATGLLIWHFQGASAQDAFGTSVAGAGDVDGDGFDDLVVGAPGEWTITSTGYAEVRSGATGALLWQFQGPIADGHLGNSVAAAGDIDADGFADVILGAAEGNAAFVLSGATGGLIWQFNGQSVGSAFGHSVSSAGDVDGDGIHELIVGAPSDNQLSAGTAGTGSAYVYSGATGAQLNRFNGGSSSDLFGSSVDGAGDVDGDGVADLIVGAPHVATQGRYSAGAAYVISGATGTVVWSFVGALYSDYLGTAVVGLGDLDGDGYGDLLVGAAYADHRLPGVRVQDAGAVYCYSQAVPITLRLSSAGISMSGAPIQLDIDLPASEAGRRYAVLASHENGFGPTTVHGLSVPLVKDALFNYMVFGGGALIGILDVNGDALHTLALPPNIPQGWANSWMAIAVVSYDSGPLAGRVTTMGCYLKIVP